MIFAAGGIASIAEGIDKLRHPAPITHVPLTIAVLGLCMGFEIAFAYTNFDNAIMYPLIVLILVISVAVNALLGVWERRILARRGLR